MYQLHWRFALSFFSLDLSARRDVFLVCSVASVVKEKNKYGQKGEHMDNDFPTGCLSQLHLSEVIWMFLCRPYKSGLNRRRNRLVSHACSFSPSKNHILTLSNMIKTIMHFSMGSILLPCNLRLAVDLWIWICLLGFIPLTVLNLRRRRTCEKCSVTEDNRLQQRP